MSELAKFYIENLSAAKMKIPDFATLTAMRSSMNASAPEATLLISEEAWEAAKCEVEAAEGLAALKALMDRWNGRDVQS